MTWKPNWKRHEGEPDDLVAQTFRMALAGAPAGWWHIRYADHDGGRLTLHAMQDAGRGSGVQILPGVPGAGEQEREEAGTAAQARGPLSEVRWTEGR